eukprot:scaffold30437_cov45-Attheya_sp.AAC.4
MMSNMNHNNKQVNVTVESLANQVLVDAGVDNNTTTIRKTNGEEASSSLDRLEGLLGIRQDHGTATAISTALPQTWEPPLSSSQQLEMEANAESLEDFAPFHPNFYRSVGRLVCHTLGTPPLQTWQRTAQSSSSSNNNKNKKDDDDKEQWFFLREEYEAVRVMALLVALLELHVSVEGSFLQWWLHVCEGNPHPIHGGPPSFKNEDDDDKKEGRQSSSCRISVVSALFQHVAWLPQLEQDTNAWIRQSLQTRLLVSSSDNTNNNTVDDPHTTVVVVASSLNEERVAQMKRRQEYQADLELELRQHVEALEHVISNVYQASHAKLRGHARKLLGGRLVHFSLSSSNNTTSGGGGRGVENTSACGIASLLRILYRILLGSFETQQQQPDNDSSGFVLPPVQHQLLVQVLVPLHRPSGMVLWRDQTPLLGLYHEPLVQCIGILLQQQQCQLIPLVIRHLLHPDIWPTSGNSSRSNSNGTGGGGCGVAVVANTPKVVLLLHEIDTYLGLLQIVTNPAKKQQRQENQQQHQQQQQLEGMKEVLVPLVLRLASCISSDNSRLSERALQYFKNVQFQALIQDSLVAVIEPLLKALIRMDTSMEIPWNPTVRRMTLLVLQQLEAMDPTQFASACQSILTGRPSPPPTSVDDTDTVVSGQGGSALYGRGTNTDKDKNNNVSESGGNDLTKLSNAMGDWRPPTTTSASRSQNVPSSSSGMPPPPIRSGQSSSSQPPLTVTGVAPWAMGITSQTKPKITSQQPPLAVTGVAPWAMNSSSSRRLPSAAKTSNKMMPPPLAVYPPQKKRSGGVPGPTPGRTSRPPMVRPITTLSSIEKQEKRTPSIVSKELACIVDDETEETADDIMGVDSLEDTGDPQDISMNPGLAKVRWYMDQLKPPGSDPDIDSDGMSSWAKAQMAESPILMPNLDLGSGAFSTVRYARRIVKDRTRSNWPEFAVKIVSTQKIEELGYEKSINREIAILRTLSHPGIARLVSSFRFRDGAYLVLEYASGGDLHTLLKRNGSLDHESTKFVTGEIVAALWSIHDAGFVFGDMKPENILITESGHIKVTDFGGCRAVTPEASEALKASGQNILRELRDGDWRASKLRKSNGEESSNGRETNDDDDDEDDLRIEGTAAYLPPEVIVGGIPTPAADAWALGCVLYQCLSGRPPLLEDTDALTKEKIVRFHMAEESQDASHEDDDTFFHGTASEVSDEAKALVHRLLAREAQDRPSMMSVSQSSFFEGTNVFALHKGPAHPLDVGSVAPVADAKWQRRQYSSIWAPQPEAYVIGGGATSMAPTNTSLSSQDKRAPILEGDEATLPFLPRHANRTTADSSLTKIRE